MFITRGNESPGRLSEPLEIAWIKSILGYNARAFCSHKTDCVGMNKWIINESHADKINVKTQQTDYSWNYHMYRHEWDSENLNFFLDKRLVFALFVLLRKEQSILRCLSSLRHDLPSDNARNVSLFHANCLCTVKPLDPRYTILHGNYKME